MRWHRQCAGDSEAWRSRPPLSRTGVSRIVQLAGIFDIVTGLLPPQQGRMAALAELVPASEIVSARAATAVIGLLLIYLGAGLRRGKRRAWQLTVVLAATSVVLHVANGLDFDAAAISAALLGLLVAVRNQFRALADPRRPWHALAALAGFAASGFVLGLVEIAVRVNRLVGDPGYAQWAQHAALGLIGVTGPLRFQHPLGALAVSVTTGAFGLLAVGVAMVLLLRPGIRRPERTEIDELHLRAVLDRHGAGDSLGYFALRSDKSLIWSPSGKAAIAYRVVNGVSLATGDPIGDPEAWPHAITAWLHDSARHGWTPAVLGCGNAGGQAYRRSGLDVVELGDEAVVDVAGFSLQGRAMRSVRQAVARVQRAGYTCQIARQRDLPPGVLAEAIRAAESLRDGAVERGFSMALSRIGNPQDGDCLLALCRDADGTVRGVLQFVPWGPDGWSLDLMRGDHTAENGLTELMVVSALQAASELDVRRVSLNFAVLRSVFARADELGAGPTLRFVHRLLRAISRFWQIESLYRANAKYQPSWQPRYLCFPTARDLPRVAVAVLQAEAFLPAGRRPRAGSPRATVDGFAGPGPGPAKAEAIPAAPVPAAPVPAAPVPAPSPPTSMARTTTTGTFGTQVPRMSVLTRRRA
jgi:lysyl-tRNA synthetase class 2